MYYENFSNYKNLIITHNQTLIKSLKMQSMFFTVRQQHLLKVYYDDANKSKIFENPFKIELVENISFNCNSIQILKKS